MLSLLDCSLMKGSTLLLEILGKEHGRGIPASALRPGMMLVLLCLIHSTTGAKSLLVLTFSKVQKRDAADSGRDSIILPIPALGFLAVT